MFFRLQAPYPAVVDTLLIPSAKFSNQKNKAHTLVRIRTGNGDLYTYIKKKRGRQVHQWDFVVSYHKSLEMKEFYRKYNSELVRLYDHNEDSFIGYLVINPWETDAEGRAGGWAGNEAYRFTLQLEELV